MSDHECVRCHQCDSCPACAADALDREVVANDGLRAQRDRYEAALREIAKETCVLVLMGAFACRPTDNPCGLCRARTALAGGQPSVRERLGRDKTVPGHPGDPELL